MIRPFTCPLSKAIKVKRYQIERISEPTLAQYIAWLRRFKGYSVVVEESQVGDILYGTLYAPGQSLCVPADMVIPAAEYSLLGVLPFETLSFELEELFTAGLRVHIPEACYPLLAHGSGDVFWEVKAIYRKDPAALQDPLWQGLSTASSKAKLRTLVLKHEQQYAEAYLLYAIRKALLEQAAIDLPAYLLKQWLLMELPELCAEELEADYPKYAEALAWHLITEQLYKEHNIADVTTAELLAALKPTLADILRQQGKDPSKEEVEKLAEAFLADLGKEHQAHWCAQMKEEELFALIKNKITLEAQPISVEAFDARFRAASDFLGPKADYRVNYRLQR